MYEVVIEENFCAAHALRGYRGNCENLHGHNWKVEVAVRGETLDELGMLIDFRRVKEATREVMSYLDHKNLNVIPPFDSNLNPTSEQIARFILEKISGHIGTSELVVSKVRVWETPTACASYEVPAGK